MPFTEQTLLAVALGANQASPVGRPQQTLHVVQPQLEQLINSWAMQSLSFHWSGLLETEPFGPVEQPRYLNKVVVVRGLSPAPSEPLALLLLEQLQQLEAKFGRDRAQEQRWGPRPLDLDLLFWGELRCDHPRLVLPHPRMHLRPFVLQPLLNAMQADQ